jgi:hypothetical protein
MGTNSICSFNVWLYHFLEIDKTSLNNDRYQLQAHPTFIHSIEPYTTLPSTGMSAAWPRCLYPLHL